MARSTLPGLLVLACLVSSPSSGQDQDLERFVLDYRRDPRPEAVPEVLDRCLESGYFSRPTPWSFTAIEFFARVLAGDAEVEGRWLEGLEVPDDPDVQALWMILWRSGTDAATRRLESMRDEATGEARQRIENLLASEAPDLLEGQLGHPVHVRMIWGRFFATGEAACIEHLLDLTEEEEPEDGGRQQILGEVYRSLGELGGCEEVESALRRRIEGRPENEAPLLRMLLDRGVENLAADRAARRVAEARRRVAQLADPATRAEASRALAGIGPAAFVPLVEAAGGDDGALALPAAEVLAGWPLDRVGGVRAVDLSEDGRRLICGSQGAFSVWEVESGRLVASWPAASIRHIALAGDRLVIVAGDPGPSPATASTWDLADPSDGPIAEWKVGQGVMSLWLDPEGKRALTTGFGQVVQLWDPSTGRLVATCQRHGFRGTGAALTPDGRIVVSTGDDNLLRRYDLVEERELDSVTTFEETRERPMITRSLALAPDGSLALAGALDGRIRIWDLSTLEVVGDLEGHEDRVLRMRFAGEGRLVSIAGDGTLRVWDLVGRRLVETVEIEGGVVDLAVAGDRAVVATEDGRVEVRRIGRAGD